MITWAEPGLEVERIAVRCRPGPLIGYAATATEVMAGFIRAVGPAVPPPVAPSCRASAPGSLWRQNVHQYWAAPLTPRRGEVALLYATGECPGDIAKLLGISAKMVRTHLNDSRVRSEPRARAEIVIAVRPRGRAEFGSGSGTVG